MKEGRDRSNEREREGEVDDITDRHNEREGEREIG